MAREHRLDRRAVWHRRADEHRAHAVDGPSRARRAPGAGRDPDRSDVRIRGPAQMPRRAAVVPRSALDLEGSRRVRPSGAPARVDVRANFAAFVDGVTDEIRTAGPVVTDSSGPGSSCPAPARADPRQLRGRSSARTKTKGRRAIETGRSGDGAIGRDTYGWVHAHGCTNRPEARPMPRSRILPTAG